MEGETQGNVIDIDAIKKRIDENRSTLHSVIDANDLLLTELVGEDVLDEATQEEILSGRTRTEVNKRLLNWLTTSDDLSTFQMFLEKLRKYGQRHVANLLDGTQGELPMKPMDVQRMKKIMGDLAKKLDLDSGLLETLLSFDALSEIAYEQIRFEPIKEIRAKKLLDNLLRGSDNSFEKFQEELVKNQPQVLESLQPESGDKTPHVDTLKANFPVLKRCTDMNLLTIAFLRADDVIDDDTEDILKSQQGLIPKVTLMQNWLMYRPAATFQAYIQVMQKNEQKHVYNLLSNNSSGQQPLSEERFQRLKKKKPRLMLGIQNRGNLLASAMRGQQASDDTDIAISTTDYEAITEERKETDRNCLLIDAVLRRTDFSFECLEKALRDVNKQPYMADLLTEGEVIGAHLNTTRPDIEDAASEVWNDIIVLQDLLTEDQELNSDENQELRICVEESLELREAFNQLNGFNLPVVATESKHSIMVYTYCKTPDDMKNYVKLLNSGQLQTIFENILNQLVKILEGESFQPLEVAVTLDDEEKMLIQEFTGLDGNQADVKDLPFISKENCQYHGNPLNFYCFECKMVVCSSCIEQDHKSHRHSDVSKAPDDLRKQLKEDLMLISSCKSESLQRKIKIEDNRMQFLKAVEESEKAVLSKCEDLKQKVERFKETLLQDQVTYKQEILHGLDYRKKAIESYLAVLKDYEDHTNKLLQQGSPSDISQSFTKLHKRAQKLQQLREPLTNKAVLETTDERMNQVTWLAPELVDVNPVVEMTKGIATESEPQTLQEDIVKLSDLCKVLFGLDQEMLQPQPNPIEQFREFLEKYMDPDFGLLEELSLPSKDVNTLKSECTPQKRNAKILDFVLENDKYKELITALTNSNQTHIVNYLNSNGAYDLRFGANWPLTHREIQIIETCRKYLVEHLQPQPLLEKLHAAQVISKEQKDFILAKQGLHERNVALLEMLKRGSLDNYKKTVECLLSSDQCKIAQMLEQGVAQRRQVNVTFSLFNKEAAELIHSVSQLLASRCTYSPLVAFATTAPL